MAEYLDIFDYRGNCIGQALRSECHGNPELLHHVAHVVVLHPETGAMLLQKRSKDKFIQPGKWDTAVGGHLDCGESFEDGALRELREELGVTGEVTLKYLFDSQIRNEIESEDVKVFGTELAGPFAFQQTEIDEVRFWNRDELEDPENLQTFTPDLVNKLIKLKETGFYPQK
jgi:isopentenyldiphosphate isomerase